MMQHVDSTGLAGKVAIISGGATLIGTEIAAVMLASGVKVLIADVDTPVDGNLEATYRDALYLRHTDITSDEDIDGCVHDAVARWKRLDFLVNVACTYLDGALDGQREDWLKALNVNVVGAAIFAARAAPVMQSCGGGVIVNFGSISGKIAQQGRLLYSTSKAAMIGMTRNLALHLAPMQIRVNSVSPGWTWSNVIRQLANGDRNLADGAAAPFHLNRRLVDPLEVANTVLFLCSDLGSGITGADIPVDGGYSALGPERADDAVAGLAAAASKQIAP